MACPGHNGTVRRIGLLGGECTGKSTLASDLAEALPGSTLVVSEILRDFVRTHGRTPLPDEQAALMAAQSDAEREAAALGPTWLIADPAPAMTAIYSLIYFDDDTLLPQARAALVAYDTLLWCDRDLPWMPDPGQRDGPHMRHAAHAAIAEAFDGYPMHLISGPREQRRTNAQQIVQAGVWLPETTAFRT